MSPRWRLILAAAAFAGWVGWLGYAALTKSRGPVVSHSQAAAAAHAVVAALEAGPDGKPADRAKVVQSLTAGGPQRGTDIFVVNLPGTAGFAGPGEYLLYLSEPFPVGEGVPLPAFAVVGPPRSPGYAERTGTAPPIYPATPDVRKQAERLVRP